jgi:hypothetical protein
MEPILDCFLRDRPKILDFPVHQEGTQFHVKEERSVEGSVHLWSFSVTI